MAAAATIAATIPAETGSTIAGVVELGEQDPVTTQNTSMRFPIRQPGAFITPFG